MKILFFLLVPFLLFATTFSVATYNVENLFDAKKSGYEYKEYIPNGKSGWNHTMLQIKIKHIARVIKDIDADIIVLQELENTDVTKRLNLALGVKKYPYIFSDFKNRGVDSVLFSRYPIKSHISKNIQSRFRPIHKVTVDIHGYLLNFFLNHWPAFSHGNKKRIKFAKTLQKMYTKEKNYILLGDFNSPLKVDENGWGKAVNIVNQNNYNLWYDYPKYKRYSHVFYKNKNALDHIIISKNIHYQEGSFLVFKRSYLIGKYKQPKRWQISKKGKGKHLGKGYSDHFALKAYFSTKALKKPIYREEKIHKLLTNIKTRVHYILKDVMVIDVNKYGVTIEDTDKDKIFIYKPDCKFEVGKIYTLHVKELATYKDKKEIVLLDFNYCLDNITSHYNNEDF